MKGPHFCELMTPLSDKVIGVNLVWDPMHTTTHFFLPMPHPAQAIQIPDTSSVFDPSPLAACLKTISLLTRR